MYMHTDVHTYTHECTAVASYYGTLPDTCLPVQTLERAPAAPPGGSHVLFEQFWLEKGPIALPDQPSADGKLPFIRTVASGGQCQRFLRCQAVLPCLRNV